MPHLSNINWMLIMFVFILYLMVLYTFLVKKINLTIV